MQGIQISVHYVGARLDIALISILGHVDTTTCHELTKVIQDLIKQKHYLIIADLGGVSYVSSAGWGVFVGEIKNIRDRGGDLKIVHMSPEVFEVFEMLEFNRILNHYDSLEETIDEFDMIRGIDITQIEETKENLPRMGTSIRYPQTAVSLGRKKINESAYSSKPTMSLKDYPLMEKVKMIVVDDPFIGIQGIRKELRTEKYGHSKIGWFRMRSILKQLNLETKEKRYRFYRSR